MARRSAHTGATRPRRTVRPRRLDLVLAGCGAIVLVPWMFHLTLTLPSDYQARHWRLTWVGFDCVLALLMGSTAVAGFHRRRITAPLAFATGTLLACDAWFDVCTASFSDVRASVVLAGVAEAPFAVMLVRGALRLMSSGAVSDGRQATGWRGWWERMP